MKKRVKSKGKPRAKPKPKPKRSKPKPKRIRTWQPGDRPPVPRDKRGRFIETGPGFRRAWAEWSTRRKIAEKVINKYIEAGHNSLHEKIEGEAIYELVKDEVSEQLRESGDEESDPDDLSTHEVFNIFFGY